MAARALRPRLTHRWPRLAPLGVALALIAAPLAFLPATAGAAPATTLSGSPYNGTDGQLDPHASIGAHEDVGSPDAFAGGVKEDTECPATNGGGSPDKADLLTGWVGNASGSAGGAGHTFLYLAWSRPSDEGSATVDFELNSGTVSCGPGSPFVKRVAGTDLLFTYDFGGGSTAGVSVRTWTTGQGGSWSAPTQLAAGKAEASISAGRLFGELVVDMTAAGFFPPGVCKAFSSATVKSRASSSSFQNQLKDLILPFPVEISNCGSLTVTKAVVGGNPGDSFGFAVDCGASDLNGEGVAGDDLSFSLSDGESRTIDDIFLGNVCSVSEADPGAGWSTAYRVDGGDPLAGRAASGIGITPGDTTVAFANTRRTGTLQITKTADEPGTFLFDIDCSDDRFDRSGVSASPGEPFLLSGIPTGTVCTVTERRNDLFVSEVVPDHGRVEIGTGLNTVAFTNTARPNGIRIDKKVNGVDTSRNDPLEVGAGATLRYEVVVTNSGKVPLSISELSDSLKANLAGTCEPSVETVLDPGEAITCSYTMRAADPGGDSVIHNAATAEGVDGFGRTAGPVMDETWVRVLSPAIRLEKTGPGSAHVGDTVTYTLAVTNPGSTALTITGVSDPLCDAPPVVKTKGGGNDQLDPGETWVYECSHVVAAGDPDRLVNTATVTGTDRFGTDVESSDDAVTRILRPAVAATKTGPGAVHVGDAVVYTIVVTNPGNTPLADVNVTDARCDGPPTLSTVDADGLLSPGEEWLYDCTHVATAGDGSSILNTAVVEGTDPLGQTVADQASHTTAVLRPAISIDKTASPASVSGSGPVTYTYVVTNTGDAVLNGVTVTDDILGAIGAVGSLAPGASVTLEETVTVDASTPPTNIGTATGTDPLGQTVTATDTFTITVVLAEVAEREEPSAGPGELPRTGAPLQAQAWAALALIQVGLIMHLSGRRRRAG